MTLVIALLEESLLGPLYWLFMNNEENSRQGATVAPGLAFNLSLALLNVTSLCLGYGACSSSWESKREGWGEIHHPFQLFHFLIMKAGPNTKWNKDISFIINPLLSSKSLKKYC